MVKALFCKAVTFLIVAGCLPVDRSIFSEGPSGVLGDAGAFSAPPPPGEKFKKKFMLFKLSITFNIFAS